MRSVTRNLPSHQDWLRFAKRVQPSTWEHLQKTATCVTTRGARTRSATRNLPSHQDWLRFEKKAQPSIKEYAKAGVLASTRSVIRPPISPGLASFRKKLNPQSRSMSKPAFLRHLARLPHAIHHPEPPISPGLGSFRKKGSPLNQGAPKKDGDLFHRCGGSQTQRGPNSFLRFPRECRILQLPLKPVL